MDASVLSEEAASVDQHPNILLGTHEELDPQLCGNERPMSVYANDLRPGDVLSLDRRQDILLQVDDVLTEKRSDLIPRLAMRSPASDPPLYGLDVDLQLSCNVVKGEAMCRDRHAEPLVRHRSTSWTLWDVSRGP